MVFERSVVFTYPHQLEKHKDGVVRYVSRKNQKHGMTSSEEAVDLFPAVWMFQFIAWSLFR